MKRRDKLTHYDIDLNKLSSSCSLWQQTSAKLYGARQQATDKVLALGRSQRTDTNNLLVPLYRCQPRGARDLIGVSLATKWLTHGSSAIRDIPSAGYSYHPWAPPLGGIITSRGYILYRLGTHGLTYTYSAY